MTDSMLLQASTASPSGIPITALHVRPPRLTAEQPITRAVMPYGESHMFNIRFRATQPSVYDVNCIEVYAVFDGKYEAKLPLVVPSVHVTIKDVTRYVSPSGSSGILVV
uniref:Uncharacterized protein n=1 Tax=Acrobeloides nanus TaxID=290746 RepID=A0A914EDH4_9BILA